LSLQFISVFLVTPQIIGEERIDAYEEDFSGYVERVRGVVDLRRHPRLRRIVLIVLFASFVGVVLFVTLFLTGTAESLRRRLALLNVIAVVNITFLIILILYVSTYAITAFLRFVGWIAHSSRSFLLFGAFLFTAGFGLLLAATWT
jgi:hypothetical protein